MISDHLLSEKKIQIQKNVLTCLDRQVRVTSEDPDQTQDTPGLHFFTLHPQLFQPLLYGKTTMFKVSGFFRCPNFSDFYSNITCIMWQHTFFA